MHGKDAVMREALRRKQIILLLQRTIAACQPTVPDAVFPLDKDVEALHNSSGITGPYELEVKGYSSLLSAQEDSSNYTWKAQRKNSAAYQ